MNTCRRVFKDGIKQKTHADYNWGDIVESGEMTSPIYVAKLDKYCSVHVIHVTRLMYIVLGGW